MTREELTTAGERLREATSGTTGEATDRLESLAEQLETLADRERPPDHGRLARIESALADVQAEAGEDVTATISEALDDIHAFRETIDGV
jgi:hypothetical protein